MKYKVLFFYFFLFFSCQNKEITILKEVNNGILKTNGDVVKAKIVLKNFIRENENEFKEAVADLNKMCDKTDEDILKKDERLASFNSLYYDKDGLYDLTTRKYKYENDPEFVNLMNEFKSKMDVFFSQQKF